MIKKAKLCFHSSSRLRPGLCLVFFVSLTLSLSVLFLFPGCDPYSELLDTTHCSMPQCDKAYPSGDACSFARCNGGLDKVCSNWEGTCKKIREMYEGKLWLRLEPSSLCSVEECKNYPSIEDCHRAYCADGWDRKCGGWDATCKRIRKQDKDKENK